MILFVGIIIDRNIDIEIATSKWPWSNWDHISCNLDQQQ